MTAEEIRKKNNWEWYGQPFENPIQAEIAAQLAELNSNLDSIANALNFIAKKQRRGIEG